MADPYWRFGTCTASERDNAPRPSFPGYLSSEPSLLQQTHHSWNPNDLRGGASSTDYLQKDMLPPRPVEAYGYDHIANISSRSTPAPALVGLTTGANLKGHPVLPIEDPSQRREVALGIISPDHLLIERPSSLIKFEDVSAAEESSILFVDGLPTDCTRREVAHLFRPFIGFKEIRVVHKEPRRSGDKASVLCFVEFNDAKCALTAMEALQDYRFDDKKPDAPVLRIQFAQFPFRPPSRRDDRRHGDRR